MPRSCSQSLSHPRANRPDRPKAERRRQRAPAVVNSARRSWQSRTRAGHRDGGRPVVTGEVPAKWPKSPSLARKWENGTTPERGGFGRTATGLQSPKPPLARNTAKPSSRRLLRESKLPGKKFGRDWVLPLASVEAYQRSNPRPGRPPVRSRSPWRDRPRKGRNRRSPIV